MPRTGADIVLCLPFEQALKQVPGSAETYFIVVTRAHAFDVREDTVLKNYPLYCPKCKQESLIDVKGLHITVIKEPDAKTQSR